MDALPEIVHRGIKFDVVMVDGDHNYYTVFNELELIKNLLAKEGIAILHDVGWPYGRGDVYYAPERIPENARHPYAKAKIVVGQSELFAVGGVNGHLFNDLYEGGPQDGVLTAVEDFVASNPHAWSFHISDRNYGLGILRRLHSAEVRSWDPHLRTTFR